ncbi:MAG: HugZ family protein [Hyphomicrobiaceae bacterium]|nr:HugZ family protein [Hyphomicrobiaceae bacterium]
MNARSDATRSESAAAARRIVRTALKGALATRLGDEGWPYASLVTVATTADGAPLMLLSDLAVHTRNLKLDQRASLMLDATDASGDPLAGGRVTLVGRVALAADDPLAKGRFLARHPTAAGYSEFADFAFYRLVIEKAHYIGGFGRIVDLGSDELLADVSDAETLMRAEREIVEHMNADHADAVHLIATRLLAAPAGDWQMIGIDPHGMDLRSDCEVLRLEFQVPVLSPGKAREVLVMLTHAARGEKA